MKAFLWPLNVSWVLGTMPHGEQAPPTDPLYPSGIAKYKAANMGFTRSCKMSEEEGAVEDFWGEMVLEQSPGGWVGLNGSRKGVLE